MIVGERWWVVVFVIVMLGSFSACTDHIGIPMLLEPEQGKGTGSVWSTSALTPLFRWSSVGGATGYEIEIDDSCMRPSDCAFLSPAIDAMVDTTSYQATALAVSTTPPVGRRYYWRVRAQKGGDQGSWGSWSAIRYVDVGRQFQDFNGDGYADLAIAAPGTVGSGAVFVYFGGPAPAATPGWSITPDPNQSLGVLLHWVGDLDGDGFSDLAFVTGLNGPPFQSMTLRIYRGGAIPSMDVDREISVDGGGIWGLLAARDVNGDGFQDLYFGRTVDGTDMYEMVLGGQSLSEDAAPEIDMRLPGIEHILGSIDINGDGFFDLLVGDGPEAIWGGPGDDPFLPLRQTALPIAAADQSYSVGLFAAGLTEPVGLRIELLLQHATDVAGAIVPDPLRLRLVGPSESTPSPCDGDLPSVPGGPFFVTGRAEVGDIDGDGYRDLVLGDDSSDANRSVLFYGGCPMQRFLVLPGRDSSQAPGFGGGAQPATGFAVSAAGDLNGDGFPDFVVGNPFRTIDSFGTGEVYVYLGGPAFSAVPALVLTNVLNTNGGQDGFGAAVE